jgi:hypothetical protein
MTEITVENGKVMRDGKVDGILTLLPLPHQDAVMSSARMVPPSVTAESTAHVPEEQTSEDDTLVEKRRTRAKQEREEHEKLLAAKEQVVKEKEVATKKQITVNVIIKHGACKYTPDDFQMMPEGNHVKYRETFTGYVDDSTGRSFLVVDKDGLASIAIPFLTKDGKTPILQFVEETTVSLPIATVFSAPAPVLATADDAFPQIVDGTKVNATVGIQLIDSKVIQPNSLNTKKGPQFSSGVEVAGVVNTVRLGKEMKEVKGLLTTANEFIPFFTQGGIHVFKSVSVSVDPDVPIVVASSEAKLNDDHDAVASSVAIASSVSNLPVSDVFQRFALKKPELDSLIEARKVEIQTQTEKLPILKHQQITFQQMLKECTEGIMNAEKLGVDREKLTRFKKDQSEMRDELFKLAINIREIEASLKQVSKPAAQAGGSWSSLVQNSASAPDHADVPSSKPASAPSTLVGKLIAKHNQSTFTPYKDGILSYPTYRESKGWNHYSESSCEENQLIGLSCPSCRTVGKKTEGLKFCKFGVRCKSFNGVFICWDWHFFTTDEGETLLLQ